MFKNYLDWIISSQVLEVLKMWKDMGFNPSYGGSDSGSGRRRSNKNVVRGCITSGYRSVKLTYENSK